MFLATPLSYLLLIPLLLSVAPASVARDVEALDVTIRVIERHEADVESFINRIELPVQARDFGDRASRRDSSEPDQRGDRDHSDRAERRSSASESARSEVRDRVEDSGQPSGQDRERAADIVDSAREARDRRQEARDEIQRQRQEARNEMRESIRERRND